MEMNDELKFSYRRWLEADEAGLDDEADEACGRVFQAAVQPEPAPLAFTSRTMQAIASEALIDARRAKRTRRVAMVAGGLGVIAATYFGAGFALSAMRTAFVGLFDLLIGAVVRTAAGVQAGANLWTLLGNMGHAASAFVADPKVTFVLLVLQGLALAALVALQRLLGSDGESWK
jgi:hypothetical protein